MSHPHPDCRVFRGHLAERLVGRPTARALAELSWHRHLFGCGRCRELLEREEALEVLLETLPEPRLPRHLAQRVLARLRASDELQRTRPRGSVPATEVTELVDELDELLAIDAGHPTHGGIAERVLAGLSGDRQGEPRGDALEHLLDIAGEVELPAGLGARLLADLAGPRRREVELERLEALLELARPLSVPGGLADRVLSGLELERGRPTLQGIFQRYRTPVLTAAALLVGLTLGATLSRPSAPAAQAPGQEELAQSPPLERQPAPAPVPGARRRPEPQADGLAAAPTERQPQQQPQRPVPAARGADPELLAMLDLLDEDLLWEPAALDLAASISLAGTDELLLEFGVPRHARPPQVEEEG